MLRNMIAFTASALLSTAALAMPIVGKPAPDFTATDALSGKVIHLADFKGKAVVLESTNPGCPFVKKHYDSGNMQKLQEAATKDGVIWISFNSSAKGKEGYLSTAKDAQNSVSEHEAHPSYYVLDPEGSLGHLYDAKTTPHMYVIDKTGTLVYMGAIDDKATADPDDITGAKNYVTDALAALKAGKPVATKQTKPYGCFVKY